ncbi:MAG: SRPBCC family protein [Methylovirgula sp.]
MSSLRGAKRRGNPGLSHFWIVSRSPSSDRPQAWTDPKHLARWWGPHGFTNPVCEVDLRVAGAIYIVMRAPDGRDYPMRGIFQAVVAPEKLVFTNAPVNEKGEPLIDGLTTVAFVARGGTTEMTLHTRAIGLAPQAAFMITGMEAGWSQSIERLEALMGQEANARS